MNGAVLTGKRLFFIAMLLSAWLSGSCLHAMESILVIRPLGIRFKKIEKEIVAVVGDRYKIEIMTADDRLNVPDIVAKINATAPRALVAIDNAAFMVLKQYQHQLPQGEPFIPSIALLPMVSYDQKSSLRNGTVLSYEIPIPVSIEKLRERTRKPISTVGVIYRAHYERLIQKNSSLCKDKNITLIQYAINGNPGNLESKLQAHLDEIRANNSVEALWLPDDPQLLTEELIATVWKPFVDRQQIPIVVPNQSLLSFDTGIGSICVVPNFENFGRQIGNTVLRLASSSTPQSVEMTIDPATAFNFYYTNRTYSEPETAVASLVEPPPVTQPTRLTPEIQPVKTTVYAEQNAMAAPLPASVGDTPDVRTITNVKKQPAANPADTFTKKSANVRESTVARDSKQREEVPMIASTSIRSVADKIQNDRTRIEVAANDEEPVSSEELVSSIDKDSLTEIKYPAGKYVKVHKSFSVISQTASPSSTTLRIAKSGERYPLIAQRATWYKVKFSDSIGWINMADATREPDGSPYATIFILFGILAALSGGAYAVHRYQKNVAIRLPAGKSCLIVARKTKMVPLFQEKKDTLSLKKFFVRNDFDVAEAPSIEKVNKILLNYIPDVIIVDWQFSTNVQNAIFKMLSDRSIVANIIIIFYNTVDAFSVRKEAKFGHVSYLDSTFTMDAVYKLVSPLLRKRNTIRIDHTVEKDLEGKIVNYNLVEIFQLLSREEKSGCLVVEQHNPIATIFMDRGRIIHARSVNATGKKAVFNVLSLTQGVFRFIPNKRPVSANMSCEVMQLLLEWTKLVDETRVTNLIKSS